MVPYGILILLVAYSINNVLAAPDLRFLRGADCNVTPNPVGDKGQCNSYQIQYSMTCMPEIPGPSDGPGEAIHPTDDEIQQIVDTHNKYRDEVGAVSMNKLVYKTGYNDRDNSVPFFRPGMRACMLSLLKQLAAAL